MKSKKGKMKNNILCTLCVLCAFLTGCNEKKTNNTIPVNGDSTAVVEETIADTLLTKQYSKEQNNAMGDYRVTMQFPVANDDNAILVNSIREWISEQMGGNYEGKLENPEDMLDFYLKDIVKTFKNEYGAGETETPMNLMDHRRITKTYENSRLVTWLFHEESYMGGAHGGVVNYGQTFRKSDGRRIGWEVFVSPYDENFQKILRQGLVEYFSENGERISEEQLSEYLQGEATQYYIPLPQCLPIFQKDGVCFLYNQYEIAAYAAGMPQFVVPYQKLKPLMNATGRRLLE